MLLIYTGNGKGKTSACIGQAIRAYGNGMKVAFGQFMKRDKEAGEQLFLSELFTSRFKAGGIGFLSREKNLQKHRDAALIMLEWAKKQIAETELTVLDEAIYALGYGLITKEEIEELLELAKKSDTHVVLSGRNVPDWLIEKADLVTEMKEIKHPFAQGHKATKGVEY